MIVKLVVKKLDILINYIRIKKLRFFGCRVGRGCNIGNIKAIGHERIIIGDFVTIEDNVRLTATNYSKNTKDYSLVIKDNSFIGYGSVLDSNQYIELNSYCMIGPYCYITDSNHIHHLTDDLFPFLGGEYKMVIIQENCWIGAHCTILPGITIKKNSVVGANSVVLKDIEKNTLNAGSPAVQKKKN